MSCRGSRPVIPAPFQPNPQRELHCPLSAKRLVLALQCGGGGRAWFLRMPPYYNLSHAPTTSRHRFVIDSQSPGLCIPSTTSARSLPVLPTLSLPPPRNTAVLAVVLFISTASFFCAQTPPPFAPTPSLYSWILFVVRGRNSPYI
jgi:hypothetical protein